ncbi:Pex12 amino terminal region-domain-containing protein [Phlebopus sp. FC_14]|nr:Pex12 amino terminal region-domain-containing protein [Phlebopus sp. FC_14]
MPASSPPSFPRAQQAQIIRANQRDLFHVASLREQVSAILRSWLGTRWLTKWDKEVELMTKLLYYGLSVGRAVQTLGEEYTDIWEQSAFTSTSQTKLSRVALVLLPALPSYVFARWESHLSSLSPKMVAILRILSTYVEVATEVNLAIFYLRGTYYDLTKRLVGVQHISSTPENPHIRPPSYSLLGILILVRLLYRLITSLRSRLRQSPEVSSRKHSVSANSMFIDDRLVSSMLEDIDPEGQPAKSVEGDTNTVLNVASIPSDVRAGRKCILCLEERTDSCATECGHLFCWGCIVGWGREKAECPLCRQTLNLARLLPIYNL